VGQGFGPAVGFPAGAPHASSGYLQLGLDLARWRLHARIVSGFPAGEKAHRPDAASKQHVAP
jgi:hypothetical protein